MGVTIGKSTITSGNAHRTAMFYVVSVTIFGLRLARIASAGPVFDKVVRVLRDGSKIRTVPF